MQIIVRHDDGTETDITDGVQVAYDVAYNSMDWGSGFLDLEEMEAVAALADACRFPSYDEALQSVQDARTKQEKQDEWMREQKRKQAEQDAKIAARRVQIDQDNRLILLEMRSTEPHLDAYPDASLLLLHQMRQQGMA